ncbi:MAG TPA: tetratricopeptide repeat protein [Bacteroidia bacterium]|nr:tetratricopeptide repeat protein [Bacteroidia bacterium]
MKQLLAIATALLVVLGCTSKPENKVQGDGDKYADSLVTLALEEVYNNPATADSIAGNLLDYSAVKNYEAGKAWVWYIKACVKQHQGRYDEATQQAQAALSAFISLGDKVGMARCYNDLGINYDFKAQYDSAIAYYLNALKLFEELNNTKGQCDVYNNIGLIHQNQGNHAEAVNDYRKALDLAQKTGYENGVLNTLNNMGSNYHETGQYDSALECFRIVLDADVKSGNKTFISYSYNNVGECYMKKGQYTTALAFFEKSKQLKEETGNRRALANTLKNIGETQLGLKDYAQSRRFLTHAALLADSLEVPEITRESYLLLHQWGNTTGDYKAALDYFKKADSVETAINYSAKEKTIKDLESKYALEKTQRELDETRHAAQTSQLQVMIYLPVTLLLILLLLAVWRITHQRQEKNRMLLEYQAKLEDQNRELEQQNLLVEEQKKVLESALSARMRFLSFMSHEIRTPLNGITGLVELLLAQPLAEGQEEYISALKRSSDNLMLLLNNVLDLNKLEAGKLDLEHTPMDLGKIIGDQVVLFKASAQARGNSIETDIGAEVPSKVAGDPLRLGQIVANLVNNAVKFTRNGNITIRCHVVKTLGERVRLKIEVEDTGVGIAEEQLQRIMEPFTQAESHTTRHYGGTGLGLTITAKLLHEMGSELKVESSVGKGSRFYFEIDFEIFRKPLMATVPENRLNEARLEGLKALVVEDNKTNALIFSKILSGWKTHFDVADNGHKAFDYAARNKYDIILMDLHLPGITGYETAQKIRTSDTANKNTPILAITAADTDEIAIHPLKGFLDGVVYKPVNYDDLLQNIRELVKSSLPGTT